MNKPPDNARHPPVSRTIILMGVTGSGKSTVGRALSTALAWPFIDADDVHPAANIKKMSRGIPLEDADRIPWLAHLNTLLLEQQAAGQSVVLACSALKARYREMLSSGLNEVRWVYLQGLAQDLADRLQKRANHFMSPALLSSQLETLEEPENALVVPIVLPVTQQVERIRKTLT